MTAFRKNGVPYLTHWQKPWGPEAQAATARLDPPTKLFLREHRRLFRERLAAMSDPSSRLYCGIPGNRA